MNAAATIAREIDDLKRRNTPSMREIRKRWSRTLRKAPADDVLATVAELEAHADQTGKWVAYELVRFHPPAFAAITEAQIEGFVGRAQVLVRRRRSGDDPDRCDVGKGSARGRAGCSLVDVARPMATPLGFGADGGVEYAGVRGSGRRGADTADLPPVGLRPSRRLPRG